jgi:hypothetical protein
LRSIICMGLRSKRSRSSKGNGAKGNEVLRNSRANFVQGEEFFAQPHAAMIFKRYMWERMAINNLIFCLIFPISFLSSFTVFYGNRAFHGPFSAVICSIFLYL